MRRQDTLIVVARDLAKAVKAVSTAEQCIDEAALEFPNGYSPKQLIAEQVQGSERPSAR